MNPECGTSYKTTGLTLQNSVMKNNSNKKDSSRLKEMNETQQSNAMCKQNQFAQSYKRHFEAQWKN